ncbi:MAG: ornithine carbamoyltransferase [Leptospirales bacterium]|nr:ornithine carbamoyltransferase [Leptospirales bacterium]
MRHLVSPLDLSEKDFFRIIERAHQHKKDRRLTPKSLEGRTVALLFEKTSTRTRLSFGVAVSEMGGNPISLESAQLQIGRGESLEDTTEVLSRYVNALMIRARTHRHLELMAGMNRIPIINGLTDLHHPCQAVADYMTMEQLGCSLHGGLRIAFVGEPNNVFNSLALFAVYAKAEITIASPRNYSAIHPDVLSVLQQRGAGFQQFTEPAGAVKGAQVIYTDTWISMGQESEEADRKKEFANYCVSSELLKLAAPGHMVLHCLPAHRGEEITAEVMEQHRASIFEQAENRLHAQKAILEWVFGLL